MAYGYGDDDAYRNFNNGIYGKCRKNVVCKTAESYLGNTELAFTVNEVNAAHNEYCVAKAGGDCGKYCADVLAFDFLCKQLKNKTCKETCENSGDKGYKRIPENDAFKRRGGCHNCFDDAGDSPYCAEGCAAFCAENAGADYDGDVQKSDTQRSVADVSDVGHKGHNDDECAQDSELCNVEVFLHC